MSAATENSVSWASFHSQEAQRIEAALARLGQGAVPEAAGELGEAIIYALRTRGKRLRPMLAVSAYAAVAGPPPPEAAYDFACAIELVHTYSLVHDDLPCMDDDDLRRGRPTLHKVAGTRTATVAGAALIPLAVRILVAAGARLGMAPEATAAAVTDLCTAAGAAGMVGGQLLDLRAENSTVSREALEAIHRRKTGALLAAALRLGGRAAGASSEQLAALDHCGAAIGLAFQITDDILDETAPTAALGKRAGRDAALGKSTYPKLFGLDTSRSMARDYVSGAVQALEHAGLASSELTGLAGYVLARQR